MIDLSKLKKSEQILLAIVITVISLGSYGLFRFMPEFQAIKQLERQAENTKMKLLQADIPDEPKQDISELIEKLDDKEQAIALLNTMADDVQSRLAPVDSQELKVIISQLARDLNIRITANERIISKLKSEPVIAAKKKTNKSVSSTQVAHKDVILPRTSSWVERMATGTLFYRPLQRIEIIGEYRALRAFVHELDLLPWQVTVIKLKVEKQPITPLRGYAQALKAELVLAL